MQIKGRLLFLTFWSFICEIHYSYIGKQECIVECTVIVLCSKNRTSCLHENNKTMIALLNLDDFVVLNPETELNKRDSFSVFIFRIFNLAQVESWVIQLLCIVTSFCHHYKICFSDWLQYICNNQFFLFWIGFSIILSIFTVPLF